MIELGVNIDHVATIRQARQTYEPDPIEAAAIAEDAGADSITVHLREDRRHIQDRDVQMLRRSIRTPMNFEMSLHSDIVQIACDLSPYQATLVPEHRNEVTTEGGLDLNAHADRAAEVVEQLHAAGVERVSAFIDPDHDQIDRSADLGFDAIELHTGTYANACGQSIAQELIRLQSASAHCLVKKLRLHAGHGLNYHNTGPVALIDGMAELNIGHAIISRAIFSGLYDAVAEMKALLRRTLTP